MLSNVFTLGTRLAAAGLLCLILACGSESDAPDSLQFMVNPDLLGEPLTVAGTFSVRPPRGWSALPGSALDEANARLRSTASAGEASTLVGLFRSDSTGAHLAVGRYATATAAGRDSVVANHAQRLQASFPDDELRQTRFSHAGYEIDQFMVMSDQTVVVTLFAHNPALPLFQLDYAIPRQSYEGSLDALESSIGSIEFRSDS